MTGPFYERWDAFKGNIDAKLINQENFTLAGASELPTDPYWAGPADFADYTYPRVLNSAFNIAGNTGAQSTGTAHTHTMAGGVAQTSAAAYSLLTGNSYGGLIRATQTYVCNLIGCAMYSVTTLPSGGTVPVQVFRQEPDNSLTLQVTADLRTFLTTSLQRFDIPLGSGAFLVQKGEIFVIRIAHRSTPTGTGLAVQGLSTQGEAAPMTGWRTSTTTDTNKNAYTSAENTAAWGAGNTTPWGYIGVDPAMLSPTDRTITDDFNRVNLGPAWWNPGPDLGATDYMQIINNRIEYNGVVDGNEEMTCIYHTAGDAVKVGADFYGPTNAPTLITLHRSRNWDSGVALHVYDTNAIIGYTYPGAGPTWNTGATVTLDNAGPSHWEMFYEPATDTYTALRNGESVGLTWDDPSNLVEHGANYRFGGIGVTRVSGLNSSPVDNWSLIDWAP